jgi:hypothetical protein
VKYAKELEAKRNLHILGMDAKLKSKDFAEFKDDLYQEYRVPFQELVDFLKLEEQTAKKIGDEDDFADFIKKKNEHIEPWLQVNLFDHFDPNIVLNVEPDSRKLNILADLPGFLVFLPIVWTWLCLSQASIAFAKLGSAKPALTKYPFLTLWNQGFDGYLPKIFWFGEFAFVAAVIALVILIAILVSSIYQSRTRENNETYMIQKQNEFRVALAEFDRMLTKHRLESPLKFGAALSEAANNLSALQIAARESVGRINDLLSAMTDASDELSSQAVGMKDGTDILAELLSGMSAAVKSIESFMSSMPKLFEEMEMTGKARISAELSGVLGELATTLKNREAWERGQLSSVQSLIDYLGQKLPEYSVIGSEIQQVSSKQASSWKAIEAELKRVHNALSDLQSKGK